MNLHFPCQRSASRKKRFDFQRFSHAADAKTPLPCGQGSVFGNQVLGASAAFSAQPALIAIA